MDDFPIVSESLESCLELLSKVLKRCVETNHFLNYEKCHFMVKEVSCLAKRSQKKVSNSIKQRYK